MTFPDYSSSVDIVQLEAAIGDMIASHTQAGTATVATVSAAVAEVTVTFPKVFASAPLVAAIPVTTSPHLLSVSLGPVTTTTAVIRMYRTSGSGNVTVAWIATDL